MRRLFITLAVAACSVEDPRAFQAEDAAPDAAPQDARPTDGPRIEDQFHGPDSWPFDGAFWTDEGVPDAAHDGGPHLTDGAAPPPTDARTLPRDARGPDTDATAPPSDDAGPSPADAAAVDARRPTPDAAVEPCDPAGGPCPCRNDEECVPGTFCGPDRVCAPGCRINPDDCEFGICDPALRECLPPPCARDDDCILGLVCLPTQIGRALELRCGPPGGAGGQGASCQIPLDCATRVCVNQSYCFAACGENADCDSGRCEALNIASEQLPGQVFRFRTCAPEPDRCRATAECDPGRVCLYQGEDIAAPNTPLVACAPPRLGNADGAPCVAAADCASRVCLGAGYCWGPCRPELGAADCAEGRRCYDNTLHVMFDQDTPSPLDDIAYGLPGCLPSMGSGDPCDAGSCRGGEVCAQRLNHDSTGFDLFCRTPVGPGGGGAPCNRNDQCASGTCLTGQGLCLGICNPDDPVQCVEGTLCRRVNFTVRDQGTPNNPADDLVAPLDVCVR